MAQHTLTKRRLFGLDRSGPPPEATRPDAPWRPWTIPNAIGYVRAALICEELLLMVKPQEAKPAPAGGPPGAPRAPGIPGMPAPMRKPAAPAPSPLP